MIADLHTHSCASDGQYSPAEVVRLAEKSSIEVLALTDHDTLDGLDEALEAGERCGVQVLRGVELGAREHKNLHILGVGFFGGETPLQRLCEEMRRGRDERKYRIIDYLHGCGVNISLDEVEEISGGKVIARPHFAQILIKRGYAANTREVYEQYLDTPDFAKIERQKPDAATCIRAIHASGGVCSWAHPYQVTTDQVETERLLNDLVRAGLDAIECYYPSHSAEQTAFYLRLCRKYHLHCTGGSDFHGETIKATVSLAHWPLELDWILHHGENN